MSRSIIMTILAVLAFTVVAFYLMCGCTAEWTRPDNGLTLEQKGTLVRLASKNGLIQLHQSEPGAWEEDVCSISTIILKALDGDEKSLRSLGLLGADPEGAKAAKEATRSTISTHTKKLLLDLLTATALEFDLHGWENTISDAVVVFDAFVASGVTTDYELWFLTREFFAGIVDGCSQIRHTKNAKTHEEERGIPSCP
ncbi:MAG: hypothetical protein JW759_08965 [Candidatus Coatesbacteria bacterium]|nr:hypothetical protein [Candidatus Coatesbacteria bacterium]